MTFLLRLSRTILLVLGVVWGSVGCAGSSEHRTVEDPDGAVAEVERIDGPERIGASDTLTVRLRGTVGPNGCYSLKRVAVERGAGRVQITPLITQTPRRDAMCTMAVVPLDETVRLDPPFGEDTVSIVVPQPKSATVTTTVTVGPSND